MLSSLAKIFLNEISKASLLEILAKNTVAVYTLKVGPLQKVKMWV